MRHARTVPAGRRALPLAPRRRAPRLEPGHGRRRCSAASGGATSRPPTRPRATARCAGSSRSATPTPIAARGRRAGDGDHEALRDRRDVARLDLARGARVARDGDERDRRALEHRRGRRGPGALLRRPALGDQAGRVGALRRDDRLPGQRRRAADQGRPGRQARRGRPAAGPQGRRATSAGCATRRPASS